LQELPDAAIRDKNHVRVTAAVRVLKADRCRFSVACPSGFTNIFKKQWIEISLAKIEANFSGRRGDS
jgi:hypothetical protein